MAGLAITFGSGSATNNFADIAGADLIMIFGANPTEAHPIVGLKFRKALRNGVTFIVGDPRKTEMASKANVWLNLLPGTNIALLNGMCHVILREGLENKAFIAERTEELEAMKEAVKKYTPEYTAKITGVPADKIIEAAVMYAKAKDPMIFYGLGVTEHVSGTKNVQALSNLVLLCGHVGRPSSGLNALRGQNNVQGAGDMGAAPDTYPGAQKVANEEVRSKFEKGWGVSLPTETGLKSMEMIDEMVAGKFKALYVLGEDPAHTDPNLHHVREGLSKLDFLVVQELFHTETTKFAHVVLPAASFAECDGTFTNGERRVQRVRKAIEPIGGKANWQTICEIATRMGYSMRYGHASEIWDEMASLSPMFAGMNYDRLDKDGLQWPCPSLDHPGTPVMHIGRFNTQNGLGKFVPLEHVPSNELVSDEYPLILTTVRQRQHYNNGSMTRRSKPINKRWPEELVWISPMDAEALGIKNFDSIKISSRRGFVTAKAKVTDGCQRGIVSMTFHFAEANGNILTNNAGDPITKTPEYKSCAVRIDKA